jgi:DNA-binding transcriptional regulator YhcF (GntR family)
MSKASRAAIIRHNVDKVGVSLRQLAKKNCVAPSSMSRMFKNSGVVCLRRQKAPLYTEDQIKRIKQNAKKLAATFQERKILIDDESYFKLKSDTWK